MSVVEKMSYENARLMLEQVGNGCTSGSFAEWPQLRPACRSILARLDALQADRDELHGRLLESSKRLLEIKADKDALQAVVDKYPRLSCGTPVVPGMRVFWESADPRTLETGVVVDSVVLYDGGFDATHTDFGDELHIPTDFNLYSTRAAAEAAMKEQSDGE